MKPPPHEKLDNLTVYRRLIQLHEELDYIAARCWSPAAGRAHAFSAVIIRALASAIWQIGVNSNLESD